MSTATRPATGRGDVRRQAAASVARTDGHGLRAPYVAPVLAGRAA